MAKKWPERVLQQSFISIFHFRSEYNFNVYVNGYEGCRPWKTLFRCLSVNNCVAVWLFFSGLITLNSSTVSMGWEIIFEGTFLFSWSRQHQSFIVCFKDKCNFKKNPKYFAWGYRIVKKWGRRWKVIFWAHTLALQLTEEVKTVRAFIIYDKNQSMFEFWNHLYSWKFIEPSNALQRWRQYLTFSIVQS